MSVVDPVQPGATGAGGLRRSELENQLNLAIRRAEQRYRQTQEQALVRPEEKPAMNPPHLGLKVDIRV